MQNIIDLLTAELNKIQSAITILQPPVAKRRGRPPKAVQYTPLYDTINVGGASLVTTHGPKLKSGAVSKSHTAWKAKRNKAHSLRMKKYWAAKRAAAKKGGKKR